MKASIKIMSIIALLGIIGAFICFIPVTKEHNSVSSTLHAGSAKVNVTPDTPIPMSGYGNRSEAFKGVHDSLYVTATVFSDGSGKSAIITADLIGFSHSLCDEIIQKIEKTTGIKKDFILLSANHNHGGPRNKAYGDEALPEVEKYVVELQQNIVNAVVQANEKLQPAMIGMGKGTCNMNINRRAKFADGSIWLGRNPDGPCDHDVSVVRIDDLNRNPIALFVNWPCHGTVSGQDNYQITGDWPGASARYVEKAFGGNVIVPVTAGASGDINPIYGPNDNFRDIEAIGMLVGEEVERVVNTIETFPNGNIEALQMTVMANGKKPLESRLPNQKLESNDNVEINLATLKVGNVLFAGVSGELMTEIGMRIKAESPFRNTVIITHCNGNSGYLCTNLAYPEGGYEAMVSR
ncbi:MAG: neutral/alkaline non-lysosomal ceramidase N-terminal domain-containing protein, partial [Cyclobacteriaceae bacterium]|nr:neutral/alkaline non-lysosomal ceramidase N-terminal domain-containing protein [Cyclobacteriaceae bacterium]